MRGSAAIQVTLRNYSIWRTGLAVLTSAGVVVLLVWAVHPGPSLGAPAALGAAALGVIVAWSVRELWNAGPVTLVWNGELWQLYLDESTAGACAGGRLEVQLDCGDWMLLRFVPDPPAQRARSRWLPAQRDASAHDWHALRCALYSPRSAPGDGANRDT
jgi:hypothetical protein